MSCERCATASQSNHETPADLRCQFDESGRFRSEGRHCRTMADLVPLAMFKTNSDGRLFSATIGFDGDFIVLAWSGDGARIAYASVLVAVGDGDAIATAVLTIDFAERAIAACRGGGE